LEKGLALTQRLFGALELLGRLSARRDVVHDTDYPDDPSCRVAVGRIGDRDPARAIGGGDLKPAPETCLRRKITRNHSLSGERALEKLRDSMLASLRKDLQRGLAQDLRLREPRQRFHEAVPDPIPKLLVVDDDPFLRARDDLLGEFLRLAQLLVGEKAIGDIEGEAADDRRLDPLRAQRVVILPVSPLPGSRLNGHASVHGAASPNRFQVALESGPRLRGHDVADRGDLASQMSLAVVAQLSRSAFVDRQDLSLQIVEAHQGLGMFHQVPVKILGGAKRLLGPFALGDVDTDSSDETLPRAVAKWKLEDEPAADARRSRQGLFELQ